VTRAPAAMYADVDRASRALGASPHALVALLFEELELALGVARRAAKRGDRRLFDDRRERAIMLLSALDHSLDHAHNPALARALATTYRTLTAALMQMTPRDADATIGRVAYNVRELADAWGQIAVAA
jgi:flagellar secretion chaperone FliS